MQQSIIEFTNFNELEAVLKEMKEVTRHQGMIIEAQAEEIEKMKKDIKKNKKTTKRINFALYQLLGGLFNHEKQTNTLQFSIDKLDGNHIRYNEIDDPTHWGIWPTTRQGDKNEKRIKKLEETLYKISQVFIEDEDKNEYEYEYEYENKNEYEYENEYEE